MKSRATSIFKMAALSLLLLLLISTRVAANITAPEIDNNEADLNETSDKHVDDSIDPYIYIEKTTEDFKLDSHKLQSIENHDLNNKDKGDSTKKQTNVTNKTNAPIVTHLKCTTKNSTAKDKETVKPKKLNIYLNNLYSRVTTNLIEEKVSVESLEGAGIGLFDVVSSDCGGSKVCPRRAGNWTANDTITIGFLGAYGRSHTVLGALPLAVAAVNRERSLLPGLRLRFVAADVGRPRPPLPRDRDALSLRVMTQMRDLGVVAFFGPDATCHTEAKLAAAWNLPLISHRCAGARGSSHNGAGLGATFARTLPPAFKVSKSVVALLRAFNWDKFAIVAGDVTATSQSAQQMDAITELAESYGMTVTEAHRFPDYIPLYKAHMERIIDDTYQNTRVYVFLGEHVALVDFVKILERRGLLAGGEYAVVAVDDVIYDPNNTAITQDEYLWRNSSEHVQAFRAVLKLTPSFPTNPHYKELCKMIRALSATPPFCVPNYHRIFQFASVPIEAAHLYDGVTLWARAATAAMRAGVPPTDGAALMQLLRPTTYRSVQGFDMYMDEAGDAEGNFTVIGLVPDAAAAGGWAARPVATFRYANSSELLPELVGGSKISWIGGAPPIAEPACGFDGAKCALPHDPGVLSAAIAVAAAAILAAALLFRHYRYEQKLASVLWRIEAKELVFIPACGVGGGGKASITQDTDAKRAYTTIALCRGNIVAVKRLQKKSIDVTRAIRKELKQELSLESSGKT
ncbi:guanylate cyclase 32E-like [Plutella xylostella]|uniref:guanylate cyclase 32E-like n=1 Tax=Plutella xylostella TaxID=51655 RepID=UPI002033098C|nr:guanylate cyclase 32E-like [Plutella xylostella]